MRKKRERKSTDEKKKNSHWRVANWGKRVTKYYNNLKNITGQAQLLLKIGSQKAREWVKHWLVVLVQEEWWFF